MTRPSLDLFRALSLSPFAVLLFVPACGDTAPSEPVDGENDFFVAGKADGPGISEDAPEACAVLKIASIAPEQLLRKDVKLPKNAVASIVLARSGADAEAATDDDVRFATLAQLDRVKWVGPSAFRKLAAFSRTHAEWACGDVAVQLLAFNDYHGAMEPPSGSGGKIRTAIGNPTTTPPVADTVVEAGGAEFLATHIKALRARNPNTLLVSAGDIIGATPLLSAAFHDEPTIESVDAMGLDISTVGNHEFDEGVYELWRMQFGGNHDEAPKNGYTGVDFPGAHFSYLSANVIFDEDGLPVFPSYTVRRFGNARVAFIGMTLKGTPDVVTAAGVEGLTFLDEAETANRLVPEIKALGIETIVVLLHEGGAATGLYNKCDGISGRVFDVVKNFDPAIDVVITGHTNAAHICNIDGRLVTSAAHNGRLVSSIDLVIDEATGNVRKMSADNLVVTRDVAKDAAQSEIIAKWKALIAPIANRVVTTIAEDLKRPLATDLESPLGNLIADAQLEATKATGAVVAFMNPGGIRTDLVFSQVSGGEQPGEVTYAELFAVQPFSNNLVTFDITGAQLLHALEEQWYDFVANKARSAPAVLAISSTLSYAFVASDVMGHRIDQASVKIGGVAVDPAKTYRVTANVFLAGGGDGFPSFKAGTGRASGMFDLEALEAWMKAHPGAKAPALGRITAR